MNTAATDLSATISVRKAAFIVTPHAGGTYSVFTNLRLALAQSGVCLEWIGASDSPDAFRADPVNRHEIDRGIMIDLRGKSPADRCRAFVDAITSGGYDLVFVNVFTSPAEMSAVAYLPAGIRRVMIVHSITPATYSAAKVIFPYVHIAVGVSPRIRDDLIKKKGFPERHTFAAPNSMDLGPYEAVVRPESKEVFRLLYLGRINDMDKGVFFLPKIMEHLRGSSVHLTVAGDGPDLAELKRRCSSLGSRITFAGRVGSSEIPGLSASHDSLIMPSRFEGLPYTLIEAMATGCVPVASRIRGSTDFVLRDGGTGLLFPIGDTAAAAAAIRRLSEDHDLWQKMSDAGKEDVRARFSVEALARTYAPILESLESPRELRAVPVDQSFRPLSIGGSWRRFLPQGLKNFLRAKLLR